MEQLFFELVKTVGPIAALVIFFIWRDYKRENLMTKRIQDVEDFVRSTLIDLVTRATQIIENNTIALTQNNRALEILQDLPCQVAQTEQTAEKGCKHRA